MSKIHFLFKAPKECYLAFSGGIDSMVLLHLLLSKKVKVTLLTVDHLTEFSKQEVEFCKATAIKYGLEYLTFVIKTFDKSNSLEAFWSNERNNIFQSMDKPVLTGHHLDDACEWYVMTSMQGCSKLLNYNNKNVYRPMLITDKKAIIEYANYYNLTYLTDPTNSDNDFNLRNKVRNELLGSIKNCFPGISKTVRRLIIKKEKS